MPLTVKSTVGRRWTAAALIAANVASVVLASVFSAGAPAQFYPLFGLIVVVAAMAHGRRAGYLCVGLTALLLAFFDFEGPGFAVADEKDALGLVLFLICGVAAVALAGAARDRTIARDQALAAAETAAKASQGLLAEFRHRLMNDLSSISFTAALQARRASTEESSAALGDLCDRISSLGRIYARLEARGDADQQIEIRPFIVELCKDFEVLHLSTRPVSVDATVELKHLSLHRSVTVGIILNELLTNSAKYAFPEEEEGGRIRVRLQDCRADPSKFVLEVEDDGVGFVETTPKGAGLGQKLIRSMAAQLQGEFSLERRDGSTVAAVVFPRTEDPER
jgi:two-component sensor histidine kinase